MSIRIYRAEDVDYYVRKKNIILVDIREISEYGEYHIPGAINVPVNKLNEFLLYKRRNLNIFILCCARGITSAREAKKYDQQGFVMGTVAGGVTAYRKIHGAFN